MRIKVLKLVRTDGKPIPAGSVHSARFMPGNPPSAQIISGEHMGAVLQHESFMFLDGDIDYESENKQLRREIGKLKEEIEIQKEAYRIRYHTVSLPWKVAEAIKQLRSEGLHDPQIICNSFNHSNYYRSDCPTRNALGKFCLEGMENAQKLMTALVNGYEVKPPTTDDLRYAIDVVVKEWNESGDRDLRNFDHRLVLAGMIGEYLGSLKIE
ncbi:hypothetical protein [Paenibacillus ehimensis]|uniref:hypothetical protein n=1 Tax=Paenibacillus ehimensis TaxID=79264 RepID=UPI000470A774|nr:hypothetical protein [Paenibacillus ehimensis]